ncbi:MAG: integrase core domain-containing protein, partial [Acidimicrobiales bacterium]
SESNFKTAKYRPDYPDRFDTIEAARTWMRRFARWYNHEHYHSGIAYLHPADLHDGIAGATIAARQGVLDAAYEANPKRFRNRPPKAPTPPTEAWINNPTIKSKT